MVLVLNVVKQPFGRHRNKPVFAKYDFTALNEVFIFLAELNPEAFGYVS